LLVTNHINRHFS